MEIPAAESDNREQHERQLDKFRPNGDRTFAVPVGEKATCHREQDEGQGEESTDNQHEAIPARLVRNGSKDNKDNQVFQAILVKGSLKLRSDQKPESAGTPRMES